VESTPAPQAAMTGGRSATGCVPYDDRRMDDAVSSFAKCRDAADRVALRVAEQRRLALGIGDHLEAAAVATVAEAHRLIEDDRLPGLRCRLGPVELLREQVGAAPRAPGQGIFAVRGGQLVEDRSRTLALVRPDRFIQSGRVGAAQRVSPDPPAEPYVQLSLHTALRCDNTIHVPGIGQASTV